MARRDFGIFDIDHEIIGLQARPDEIGISRIEGRIDSDEIHAHNIRLEQRKLKSGRRETRPAQRLLGKPYDGSLGDYVSGRVNQVCIESCQPCSVQRRQINQVMVRHFFGFVRMRFKNLKVVSNSAHLASGSERVEQVASLLHLAR